MVMYSGTTGTTRRPLDRMLRYVPLDDPGTPLEDYFWREGIGVSLLDVVWFAHFAAVCRHFVTPADFAALDFADLFHGEPVWWR